MKDYQETLLFIIYNLMNQKQLITLDAIARNLGWTDCDPFDIAAEIAGLVARGFLVRHGNEMTLTEMGQDISFRIHKERTKKDFNRLIGRYCDSGAYLDYCEEIYGYRLYLFNMMDKAQLDYLFNDIPIAAGETILDLGCGSGGILKRLVAKYGCRGVGIDQLDSGIPAMNGSTVYIDGNIDNFGAYRLQPYVTIAIDILYFSSDLDRLLVQLKDIKRNRMYLYYSQYIFDEATTDKIVLHPDHTHLAQMLRKNGIGYHSVDYSANEHALYEQALRVLPEYQPAFASEGNLDLYEAKRKENQGGKELYDKGLASRFLYIVA